MEFDQTFNLFEGILWVSISVILATRLRRGSQYTDLLVAGALAFFAFGISDFIEVVTRAWYRPLPLLLLKAACVVALLFCLIVYRRRNRRCHSRSDDNAGKRANFHGRPRNR